MENEATTDARAQAEEFVAAIESVSEAASALLESGLTQRGLVALLRDYLGADAPGKRVLNQVLDALPLLAEHYLDGGAE